ncbi:SGNH/GDSL hydrolase family protein [Nocardioides piscis]|uniref:SGNH/GDSL hydrolase family protein n=1 Tax=Nocardioides piscis TaxID=2714938 RepID=A0A6G7YKM9_9ACTN|nr:SGNH/GDSL hydrolase family protein [Nocardioides piscis]QIK77290.1 SGNH/GDSL hydrolase family protein [Nocardioides piscis]
MAGPTSGTRRRGRLLRLRVQQGASHCGDRSFATRVRAARDADLVVVAGGLNDHDQSAADIRAGLRSLVNKVGTHELVVVGPATAPARAARVGRVDTVLEQLCAELDVPYVDASAIRLDYLPDRLHLTAAGHAAFGDFVAAELRTLGLLD